MTSLEGSNEAVDSPYSVEDVMRVGALLDQAAAESSRYRRFSLARRLFLEPHEGSDVAAVTGSNDPNRSDDEFDDLDDPDDRAAAKLPLLDAAAWAAMRYHVELTVEGEKERARMEPHFIGPDATDPPPTDAVSTEVAAAWMDLAAAVTTPAGIAAISHLVFQVGRGDVRSHAQLAVDANLELSRGEVRHSDAVHAARVAVRLARAIGDTDKYAEAVGALEDAASRSMSAPTTSVGATRAALGTLVRERSPNARALVEQACAAWPADQARDMFWPLMLKTAVDSADKEQIWRDRVENSIALAEHANSNILRAARLRVALELAEASGIPDLRERAAVLVQGIRNLELEMMRIHASSFHFDEQVEEVIASILQDPSSAELVREDDGTDEVNDGLTGSGDGGAEGLPVWYLRLRAFAQFEPPTGDPDANRELVARQRQLAPLQSLFPMQLQTPEGLPLYAPQTDEERFELDLVKWETELLGQWTNLIAEALHRMVTPELPPFDALAQVLSDEPASDTSVGRQLAASFYRYWSGDGQGAVYTALPMLEALVRNAVLNRDRGIYRLQKNQVPGQYVGLGVLLDLFVETYKVSERDERFFGALLKHPGGWNLRNLLAHGYLPDVSGRLAAIVLYAAMRILVLGGTGRDDGADDPPNADEPQDTP